MIKVKEKVRNVKVDEKVKKIKRILIITSKEHNKIEFLI